MLVLGEAIRSAEYLCHISRFQYQGQIASGEVLYLVECESGRRYSVGIYADAEGSSIVFDCGVLGAAGISQNKLCGDFK
jgi:hypothetical protein